MSKTSYKYGIAAKHVFALPIDLDKNGKPQRFRITDKGGRKVKIVKNGLSV